MINPAFPKNRPVAFSFYSSDIDPSYNPQYIYHTARGLDFGKPIFYNNSITRLGAGKELAV